MKSILALALTGAVLLFGACQSTSKIKTATITPKATLEDFKIIEGEWEGTLTYTDYSSGDRVTIPANAVISIGQSKAITYKISYPKEPWEDAIDKIYISENGRDINGHVITQRKSFGSGGIELITEYEGQDNKKDVTVQEIYKISPSLFSISKNISLKDETDFKNRNIYRFVR